MATFHQSELAQWARCPAAANYERQAVKRQQLSATAYGSVMHYAILEVFERMRHQEGVSIEQATAAAIETFRHYWNPLNISSICDPVDVWLPKQNFNVLLQRGEEAISAYVDLVRYRDEQVLATEFGFQVPIDGTWDEATGAPHILAGTVDRLAVLKRTGREYVEIGDLKSGKEYPYLRQHVQIHGYAYASTKLEFWVGWNGEDGFGPELGAVLHQRFLNAARRGSWFYLPKMKIQDAGWRGPVDYHRFAVAINELAKAYRHDVWPLNISGSTCTFCEFKDICAETGVADDEHGAPLATPRTRKKAAA